MGGSGSGSGGGEGRKQSRRGSGSQSFGAAGTGDPAAGMAGTWFHAYSPNRSGGHCHADSFRSTFDRKLSGQLAEALGPSRATHLYRPRWLRR